jgi:hypothetical protein
MMAKELAIGALTALFAAAISGCIPLGNVGGVDQATANQLRTEIPLYDSTAISGQSYKSLGKLNAWSCDETLFGGGGDQVQLVAKLRQQAKSIGANALMDLNCGKGAGASPTGCIASLTCDATAIKLGDTASN